MFFQWPLFLFSLSIIPLVVLLYILIQRRRQTYAARFTNLALLRSVAGPGPGWRRHLPPLLFLLALTALLASLARPMAVLSVPREQATVLLLIDTSGSMEARDMSPNRMEAAKQAAQTFVKSLPQHMQVGLITFSGTVRVRNLPTLDHQQVLRSIDLLQADGSTAIGDALQTALDQVAQQQKQMHAKKGELPPATIVLLSDGANTVGSSPIESATRARNEQVRVNTIAIGKRGTASTGSGFGSTRTEVDWQTLQQVATMTGGKYFYAEEARTLQQIYTELSSRIGWVQEQTEITALMSAAGAILLLIGGMLSLLWFQRLP
ncbi:MAG: VWA domain-containing protein [Ktedonobacteraceae bacterium]|nr:VWA domain-containing protein [Ktedonobacteraceae bacterium]